MHYMGLCALSVVFPTGVAGFSTNAWARMGAVATRGDSF